MSREDDMISRQAVFNTVTEYRNQLCEIFGDENELIRVVDIVKHRLIALPSAQPEPDEWCTDCKEYDHDRHCCPRWNRVIRETLKDAQAETIRCRDCKHRDPEDKKCDSGHDIVWNLPRQDDWFCADAKRRTDDGE